MKRLTINAVTNNNEVEKYYFIGQKDNGFEVEGYFSLEELASIIGKIEKIQSTEEKKNAIINEKIKEEVNSNSKNIEKYKDLIERWKVDTIYNIDDLCQYNDIIFKAKKKHIASYDTLPINDTKEEYFTRVNKEEATNENVNQEWQQHFSSAENFQRDKSYKQGDYVKYYNELYKAKRKITSEQVPSKISEDWEYVAKNKGQE